MSNGNQRYEKLFDLSDVYSIDMKSVDAGLTRLPEREPDFIEPMECALVSTLPAGSDWIYEIKLDGYRAVGVRTSPETTLYSRNHKNFSKRFPQIAEALRDLPAETVIDGEFATVFLKGADYTGVFDGRFTSKKSTQQASRATEPRNSSSYRTMHRKPSISCHARFVPFRAADFLACHDPLSCPEIPRKL